MKSLKNCAKEKGKKVIAVKPIKDLSGPAAVAQPLVDLINDPFVKDLNEGLGYLEDGYSFLKCEAENTKILADDINQILRGNFLIFIRQWLVNILGLPLEIALIVAIVILSLLILGWIGGIVSIIKLFI
jgi:hypothetical protein